MSPEDVMSEIEPSLAFIRGVTVSGGECTLYPDFLRALGGLVKERSLSFFLDSNGSYDYAGDPALMAVTDGVMLDVKADPDASEYRRITGRNGPGLLKQLDFLAGAGKLWEARTVVSPGLLDAPALVDMVCRRLAGTAGPPRYKLIRYRPAGVRRAAAEVLTEPGVSLMERLAAICTKHGIKAEAV
jgi:pyruvate formate lyase activating enzyme